MPPTISMNHKHYKGSGSFATFMIIGPTCFFLGLLFAALPYDYPLLWSKAPVDASFFNQLEQHLVFMHQSPPLISRILNIALATVFVGLAIKMFRPSEANLLFDGATGILYLIAVAVYTSNTVKGLRTISSGMWHTDEFKENHEGRFQGEVILGREDSLKVLAASNTILALIFVGVLVLQAGEWYAEKKDEADQAKVEAEADAKPGKKETKKSK